MLTITPFGRLGNNIAQILKCLCYSLSFDDPLKINFTLMKKEQPNIFNLLPDTLFENNSIERVDSFWNEWTFWESNFNKAAEILMNLMDYSIQSNIDFNNSLIIHFRGGDSMDFLNWKHPPYYFYKNIIDNSNYKNIILVIEDYKNPVINKLLSNYNHCYAVSNSVSEDFKIIMNAIHFVDSQSSFSSSALCLNKNIKTLYTTPQMHHYRKNYNNSNVINYNLEQYHNKPFNNFDEYHSFLLLDKDPFKE